MGNWRLRPIFCAPWNSDAVHFFPGARPALPAAALSELIGDLLAGCYRVWRAPQNGVDQSQCGWGLPQGVRHQ
ncbi:hypothetical protein GCM10009753_37630 [Streptantibioticus ferralitis]